MFKESLEVHAQVKNRLGILFFKFVVCLHMKEQFCLAGHLKQIFLWK